MLFARTSLVVAFLFVFAACGTAHPSIDGGGADAARDASTDGAAHDGGGGDATVDAGSDDAGGSDAGTDAGPDDAGTDDAGSDAGTSCGDPSECPGADTECAMRTCGGGICGVTFTAAGTPTAVQTPGDCMVNECDGAGLVHAVPADDVMDDGNQCTTDTCVAGTPTFTNAAAGAGCASGGGVMCDGAGNCVECVMPSQCGADLECATMTCLGGACGTAFTPAGTPTAVQVAGNCQRRECDGAGLGHEVIDDADTADDGNACTEDLCSAGTPTHTFVGAGSTCPGGTCDATGGCIPTPTITSVDYPVIAEGGRLVITGTNFTGATTVTVGGVSETFTVDSATQITIASMAETGLVGNRSIIVSGPGAPSAPFAVTVIALQINELDCNQAGSDTLELVELTTGVPGVSLAGYTLVFWNGGGSVAYFARELAATTGAGGLLLVGNTGVVPMPGITFPGDTLQNGEDAVGIYQALPTSFTTSGAGATPVTALHLIDALVYDTADPDATTLLDTLLGAAPAPGRVQVDEGSNASGGISETQSIQRCSPGRLDGRKFGVAAPTAGAANTLPACP